MRAEQTVEEMAEEVLGRQARALVDRTGSPSRTRWRPYPRPMPVGSSGSWRTASIMTKRRESGRLAFPGSVPRSTTTRGLRATWSGWKARRRAPSTTRSWRRNSLA
jgi:hypothetical protein